MVKRKKAVDELLSSLDEIKIRLGENPRDDHLSEVEHWENTVRTAAIRLSIEKNEGVAELIRRAKDEIKLINEALLSDSNKITFTENTTAQLVNREIARQELLSMRKLWTWFLSFFIENKEELDQANKFVDEQIDGFKEEESL